MFLDIKPKIDPTIKRNDTIIINIFVYFRLDKTYFVFLFCIGVQIHGVSIALVSYNVLLILPSLINELL